MVDIENDCELTKQFIYNEKGPCPWSTRFVPVTTFGQFLILPMISESFYLYNRESNFVQRTELYGSIGDASAYHCDKNVLDDRGTLHHAQALLECNWGAVKGLVQFCSKIVANVFEKHLLLFV